MLRLIFTARRSRGRIVVFSLCQHDNSRTAAQSLMKVCMNMYLKNIQNPIEFQGHSSRSQFFCIFCLHDTRGQYLALSEDIACLNYSQCYISISVCCKSILYSSVDIISLQCQSPASNRFSSFLAMKVDGLGLYAVSTKAFFFWFRILKNYLLRLTSEINCRLYNWR